ncbi:MAG: hypothetical protein HY072_01105 [Deltaproteobacteria bacterium]|nr:hypothetical protein [Deltaproteobacteria bacterium]
MQRSSFTELYETFLDFVRQEIQKERSTVNKKMLSVLLWCFVFPALLSIIIVILTNLRILPFYTRHYLDWILLAFPVFYALYFLNSEVLKDLPSLFKKGGMTTTLNQALKDTKWREHVCDELEKKIKLNDEELGQIASHFKIDLDNLYSRIRFITVLAGAVFFLILKGLDLFFDTDSKNIIQNNSHFINKPSNYDFSELIVLGLFLIIFYLSGNQTYRSLLRFLQCTELCIRKRTEKKSLPI